jgi:hypothetical protein
MEAIGQLHASAAKPPGKGPQYPLSRRLGRPQTRSGCFGVEKNLLPLPGIEFRLPALILSLYRLSDLVRYLIKHRDNVIFYCESFNGKGKAGKDITGRNSNKIKMASVI